MGGIMENQADQASNETTVRNVRSSAVNNSLMDPGEAFRKAWEAHVSKLDPKQVDRFVQYKQDGLEGYIQSITANLETQRRESKLLKVNEWFQPIFDVVQLYMPTLNVAASASQAVPNPSSVILGGISFIIQISNGVSAYQTRMAKVLSDMGFKAMIISQYQEHVFHKDERLEQALIKVYLPLLDFCRTASDLLLDDKGKVRGGLRTFGLSFWKSFDQKFGSIVEDFDGAVREVDELARLQARTLNEIDRNEAKEERKLAQASRQTYQESLAQQESIARGVKAIGNSLQQRQQLLVQEQQLKEESEYISRKKELCKWLECTNYEGYYGELCHKHLSGSGQWLLERQEYSSWKTGDEGEVARMLFVKGKAGSGKSFLSAMAISDLEIEKETDTIALAYVFCKASDEATGNSIRLALSILKQLLDQATNAFKTINLLEQKCTTNKSSDLDWYHLEMVLISAISQFNEVFIVVDGFDECKESESFAQLLQSLTSQPGGCIVRLLVFSRPDYQTLEKAFQDAVPLWIDDGSNLQDIRLYIDTLVSEGEIKVGKRNPELLSQVKDTLFERSDSMFLWVYLMVQTLRQQSKASDVARAIESVPKGLDSRYIDLLLRIEHGDAEKRNIAFKIILFTLRSSRELSQKELFEAIEIHSGMTYLEPGDFIEDSSGWSAACADLVRFTEGVEFIHASFRDCLESEAIHNAQGLERFSELLRSAQDVLAEICLTYMLLENFTGGARISLLYLNQLMRDYPFLAYAANRWQHHVSNASSKTVLSLATQVINNKAARELSLQIALTSSEDEGFPYSKSNPLHLAAWSGVTSLADTMPHAEQFIMRRDSSGRKPLDYALMGPHIDMCMWLVKCAKNNNITAEMLEGESCALHLAVARSDDLLIALLDLGFDVNQKAEPFDETPLLRATSTGNLKAARILVERGADVNQTLESGTTPLMDAVLESRTEFYELLLGAGANVNAAENGGYTALHFAVENRDKKGIECLVRYGADVTVKAFRGFGQSALHCAAEYNVPEIVEIYRRKQLSLDEKDEDGSTALHYAALNGSEETARQLIANGASLSARDNTGRTPLHDAANGSGTAIVGLLLQEQSSATYLNSTDENGATAVHIAADNGNLEATRLLITRGAEIDVVTTDEEKVTPLLCAMSQDRYEVARLLIEHHASVTASGEFGGSPLHHIAALGDVEFLELLHSNGALVNECDDVGNTPLHCSARAGNYAFTERLLELYEGDIDINMATPRGRTPLHHTASAGQLDIAKLLVDRGAIIKADEHGDLPMHLAAYFKHAELVRYFVTQDNIDTPGKDDQTVAFIATQTGQFRLVEWLYSQGATMGTPDRDNYYAHFIALREKNFRLVEYIMGLDIDVDVSDHFGNTLLHVATEVGALDIARKLLEKGCDGEAKNRFGSTPIHTAVTHGKSDLVDLLLEKGVNHSSMNHAGMTPVHYAAREGWLDLLKKLRSLGADIFAIDQTSRNSVHWAAFNGHVQLVAYLVNQKVPYDAVDAWNQTPLHIACSGGYLDVFRYLIKLQPKPDLNIADRITGYTPFMRACSGQSLKMMRTLAREGADITATDVLGQNVYRLHGDHYPTMYLLQDLGADVDPMSSEDRRLVLINTLKSYLSQLLDDGKPVDPWLEMPMKKVIARGIVMLHMERYNELEETAPLELQEDKYRDLAIPFFIDQTFRGKRMLWANTIPCSMCDKNLDDFDTFSCASCFTTTLCAGCYNSMQKKYSGAGDWYYGFLEMERLEKDLTCLHYSLQNVSPTFIRHIMKALNLYGILTGWLDYKWREYKTWEEQHNTTSYFEQYRPGQELLRKWNDSQANKEAFEWDHSLTNEESKFVDDLQQQLAELQREHRGDREQFKFCCTTHQWLRIERTARIAMQSNPGTFNDDGSLTKEWLRTVLNTLSEDSDDVVVAKDGEQHPGASEAEVEADPDATLTQTPKRAVTLPPSLPAQRKQSLANQSVQNRRTSVDYRTGINGLQRTNSEKISGTHPGVAQARTTWQPRLMRVQTKEIPPTDDNTTDQQMNNAGPLPQKLSATISPAEAAADDCGSAAITSPTKQEQSVSKAIDNTVHGSPSVRAVPADMEPADAPPAADAQAGTVAHEDVNETYKGNKRFSVDSLSLNENLETLQWIAEIDVGNDVPDYSLEDCSDEGSEPDVTISVGRKGSLHWDKRPTMESRKRNYKVTMQFDPSDYENTVRLFALRFTDAVFPGFARTHIELERSRLEEPVSPAEPSPPPHAELANSSPGEPESLSPKESADDGERTALPSAQSGPNSFLPKLKEKFDIQQNTITYLTAGSALLLGGLYVLRLAQSRGRGRNRK